MHSKLTTVSWHRLLLRSNQSEPITAEPTLWTKQLKLGVSSQKAILAEVTRFSIFFGG